MDYSVPQTMAIDTEDCILPDATESWQISLPLTKL